MHNCSSIGAHLSKDVARQLCLSICHLLLQGHQEGSFGQPPLEAYSLSLAKLEPSPNWVKEAQRPPDWAIILDQPEARKSLEPTPKSLQPSLSLFLTLPQFPNPFSPKGVVPFLEKSL